MAVNHPSKNHCSVQSRVRESLSWSQAMAQLSVHWKNFIRLGGHRAKLRPMTAPAVRRKGPQSHVHQQCFFLDNSTNVTHHILWPLIQPDHLDRVTKALECLKCCRLLPSVKLDQSFSKHSTSFFLCYQTKFEGGM